MAYLVLVDNLHLVILILLDLVGRPSLSAPPKLVPVALEDRQVEIPAGSDAVVAKHLLQNNSPLLPELGPGLLFSDVVRFHCSISLKL